MLSGGLAAFGWIAAKASLALPRRHGLRLPLPVPAELTSWKARTLPQVTAVFDPTRTLRAAVRAHRYASTTRLASHQIRLPSCRCCVERLPGVRCLQQRQVKRWSGRHAESVCQMDLRPSPNNLPRAQFLAERAFATLQHFLHVEAVSGVVLLIAAAVALIWANSPFANSYHALWHLPLSIGLGEFVFSKSLQFWINDALMTVFFLVVGMEIRREMAEELQSSDAVAVKDTHRLEVPLRQLRVAHREILPPVVRVQTALHPWVAYGIMPLFALANAGVSLTGVDLFDGGVQFVMLGVVLALVAGKPIGVVGATWLAVRLGWCRLAPGVSWGGVGLVGLLAGIGFTMSIFIAMLAFSDERLLNAAKLGVLLGSLVAAVLGLGWGAGYVRRIRPLRRDKSSLPTRSRPHMALFRHNNAPGIRPLSVSFPR